MWDEITQVSRLFFICMGLILLAKALYDPMIGILLILVIERGDAHGSYVQFRQDVSLALKTLFMSMIRRTVRILFLLGEDLDDSNEAMEEMQEPLSPLRQITPFEFLDVPPTEEKVIAIAPPPPLATINRNRRRAVRVLLPPNIHHNL